MIGIGARDISRPIQAFRPIFREPHDRAAKASAVEVPAGCDRIELLAVIEHAGADRRQVDHLMVGIGSRQSEKVGR